MGAVGGPSSSHCPALYPEEAERGGESCWPNRSKSLRSLGRKHFLPALLTYFSVIFPKRDCIGFTYFLCCFLLPSLFISAMISIISSACSWFGHLLFSSASTGKFGLGIGLPVLLISVTREVGWGRGALIYQLLLPGVELLWLGAEGLRNAGSLPPAGSCSSQRSAGGTGNPVSLVISLECCFPHTEQGGEAGCKWKIPVHMF